MGALKSKDKQEWAKTLFVKEHLTQKEIASRVGTTESTIGKWKEKFGWEKLKASYTISKPEQLQRIYEQINELTAEIKNKPEGKRYASSKEADILNKLAVAAQKLEADAGVDDIINVFIEFLEWLRPQDLSKAQEISKLQDEFIKTRLQ